MLKGINSYSKTFSKRCELMNIDNVLFFVNVSEK